MQQTIHPSLLGRWFLIAIVALSAVITTGCSDELDPTEPKDAYVIFRDALFSGDGQVVWERTDEQTHAYFEQRYGVLVEMDELIRRYLPQTDVKLARKQSGTVLLDEVSNGRELFLKVYSAENVPSEEAVQLGSNVDEVKVAEDGQLAKVVTRAGQEYIMTRDEQSEEWFVMLVKSNDAVEDSFDWLDSNEEALTQTVEDLIKEEREKREEVIAELMGFDQEK
ncbi:MAG: hypothetical protein ACQEVA_15505 [Myxococcota bacterium]